ncbi:NADP-dependent phosphogluconate dehydrogenase [Alloyangia pacifica]|uniref:NADP-dependent phosphogluconate dehydrogenase n=1 Tax=Alloyangia pacifica TaxID=311180 RepID=UPI001CFF4173|nr:NADP-dependent phosphogluconate dehydrogenase [Alloyangia pacifica]
MTQTSDIGLIGLGTMGAALALNIADNDHQVSVYNRTASVTRAFVAGAGVLAERLLPTEDLATFVGSLQRPRTIILMVPAGPVVDQQIEALRGLLEPGDLIVDAGNANYADTNRRAEEAAAAPYDFIGIGVSGGEEGARHGPSIMVGGDRGSWLRLAPLLKAIAAKHEGTPCAAYMGPAGAGHFVKMVHNGIEYADMQMIAETYSLMGRGLGLDKPAIAAAFDQWNAGPLASYLVEIAGRIARSADPLTRAPMLDVILDKAGQKGTGRWTAIEAQHLGVAVPVIEAAVCARNLSAAHGLRQQGADAFGAQPQALPPGALDLDDLEAALIAGKILCYAQGFEMLTAASDQFGWDLPLPEIARIWRNGCIIRSDMLNDMASALDRGPGEMLVFAQPFRGLLEQHEAALRRTVLAAIGAGIAVPALSAGLGWFDSLRTRRSPANMIQAQRDFFGAHGFERLDGRDAPHGPWAATAA